MGSSLPEEPELGGPFDKRRSMPRRYWPIHPLLVDEIHALSADDRDLWAERAAIMWQAYGVLRPESGLKVYWVR